MCVNFSLWWDVLCTKKNHTALKIKNKQQVLPLVFLFYIFIYIFSTQLLRLSVGNLFGTWNTTQLWSSTILSLHMHVYVLDQRIFFFNPVLLHHLCDFGKIEMNQYSVVIVTFWRKKNDISCLDILYKSQSERPAMWFKGSRCTLLILQWLASAKHNCTL